MTATTAAQIAVHDQASAFIRDLAAGGMPVLFADFPAGQVCCWCNCSARAPETAACPGCPEQADAVLRIYLPAAQPAQYADCWPVCRAHHDDAMAAVQALVATLLTGAAL